MSGNDSKYFSSNKRGEIAEFREELRTPDKNKKRDAVKKVIAAMTVGKDVSMLFPDVVNCMQTDVLELKKLVYLYLINYAKTQPDLAIMAVNTFVKDSQDPNPLIRALAVRTMGCIRVDKITEYLCDPLEKCLKDDDPYVRKTAAICVAKLFDINPELVEDRGFLETLKDLLGDSNPMVVANAVAALAEIQGSSAKEVFRVTQNTIFKLLAALNECTEWGQVFILDALAGYQARSAQDAANIVERVTPRLQHANCAVVLSAVKVVMRQMEVITSQDDIRTLCKKMAPPLVTLLSGEPEIQYVALRNINLIVQRRPQILAHEVKVFFCKYNDPIYVKMEKLEIMIKLASDRNIDQVLLEFKEYATEVDVDFVRKAVRAIGRCAVSLERAAERCINVLLELIQTKVNYVVQEAIIVIKDIFRRYPNTYESIIATLCENLDTLDEPEAKASMIWIIGEYAERIDNADELLETFLETFPEEAPTVQLQLLTATVKLFLKKPTDTPQQMIQLVLSNATQETDNPDLRDRAYVYWRLLSTDPEAAKDVVLAEKPVISDDTHSLEPSLLEELLSNIATLASVYHKPPDTFVSRVRVAVHRAEDLAADGGYGEEDDQPPASTSSQGGAGGGAGGGGSASAVPAAAAAADPFGGVDLLGGGGGPEPAAPPPAAPAGAPPAAAAAASAGDLLGDLLGMDAGAPPAPAPAPAGGMGGGGGAGADPFGLGGGAAPAAPAQAPAKVLLAREQGKGLQIAGRIRREGGQVVYDLTFTNGAAGGLDGFMIQFNKNSFGLAPSTGTLPLPAIPPGQSASCKLPVLITAAQASPGPANTVLQIAIKTNQLGVFYLTDAIPLTAVLGEGQTMDLQTFLQTWQGLPDANERQQPLRTPAPAGTDAWAARVQQHCNLYLTTKRARPADGFEVFYFSCRAPPGLLLIEVAMQAGMGGATCRASSSHANLAELVFPAMEELLAL